MKFHPYISLAGQTFFAFAALAGSAACLVWLERQNSTLPVPAATCWDAAAPLVIVDAGHGGHDGGAVANNVIEKNLSLDLARRLKRELEISGLRVLMTRNSDRFLSLEDRAALAGKHRAAAFVSVHLNTDGSGSAAEGIETYFAAPPPLSSRQTTAHENSPRPPDSAQFAAAVQRLVCASTKAQDRGIKARSYAVVSQAPCPAVLVECGFLTSEAEAARLQREPYRDQVAAGIARGVVLFLQAHPSPQGLVAGF